MIRSEFISRSPFNRSGFGSVDCGAEWHSFARLSASAGAGFRYFGFPLAHSSTSGARRTRVAASMQFERFAQCRQASIKMAGDLV
jgi:hypothetical protein